MMVMSSVSQRHPWGLPTLPDGSYFIDRDPKMFKYVLNYLRNKQLPVVPEGRENKTLILLRKLRLAFEYFMLTGFEFEESGEAPPVPQRMCAVCVLGGGYGAAGATVDRFDVDTGVWTAVAPMQTARENVGAVCLTGIVYAVGGEHGNQYLSSVERYDPGANAWSFVAAMNEARSFHAVCVLNGHIYAVGGYGGDDLLTSVERYDPSTDSWTFVTPTETSRCQHAVCVLDDCIFASGGYGHAGRLASIEKFDPQTDSWSAVAPMQHARYHHAMAVLDCHIYIAGGLLDSEDEDPVDLPSVERYDAATDSWSSVADMVHAHPHFGLSVVNGRLTAVGGCDTHTVEQYDAAADTWSVVPAMQMPSARQWFASCTVESDAIAASTHTGRDNAWGRLLRERMKDATPAECKREDV
jgi:N-acetylneuraminic acid mutarotase